MAKIIYDQPAAEYFAEKALNNTSIGYILECPALYKAHQTMEETPSKAFLLGSLVHAMVLEPDKVAERYAVCQYPGTTKAGKEERKALAEKGITAFSGEDWLQAKSMSDSLLNACPTTAKLLALPGKSEVSLYWEEELEDTKLACKARVDRLAQLPDGSWVAIDLKTTADTVKPSELARKAYNYGYHRQAAWYTRGLKACGIEAPFIFFFVSKQAPYLVTPLSFTADALALGDDQCMRACRTLIHCQEDDEWPAYTTGIYEVDLPEWAYYQASK